jgi:hypothetical protein
MTGKQVIKLASAELSEFMLRHGYPPQPGGYFAKAEDTLEKWITLTTNRWSGGGGFHLEHYCWYRLPAFTEIHTRNLPHVSEKEKTLHPTISMYYVNLLPRGFDWNEVTVASELDIPRVARNIERICVRYSFPFLDRFSTADAIVEGYRGERDAWPDGDPLKRYELLLLDSVIRHDAASFARWCDEALKFCRNRTDGRAIWLSNLARRLEKDYFPA